MSKKKQQQKKKTSKKQASKPKASTANSNAPKPKASKVKPAADRKPSGLDLAADVLAKAKQPLNAKQIAEKVIEAGWQTNGATPHATLYAAMLRDERFERVDRGLWSLANKKGGGK